MPSLAPSALLELLVDREGKGALGEFEFTPYGLSPWAYTRASLVVQLTDALSGTDWVPRFWTDASTLRAKAAFAARALREHPRLISGEFPIVFFCSGVGNYLRDGAYVNRLSDHFADCDPDRTLLIEDSHDRRFSRPRRFPHVAAHDAILVGAVVEAKLRRESARDRKTIDDFVARLRDLFGDVLPPTAFDQLRHRLIGVARQAPAWRRAYLGLFERFRPRVILVEDACYGHRSHLIRWAREHGIASAEYQHGHVGSNHEAYHYHPSVLRSTYANNFPDHFLTYGRYWVQYLGIPSRPVVIGNPHLTEAVRSVTRRNHDRTALYVSGALGVDVYRRVLAEIAQALPAGFQLVFRPHPSERGSLEDYRDVFERHAIRVDEEKMAYQSIADADLILGDVSTLLFEAAALGRPVVVYDCEESRRNIPSDVFPFVRDLSTIASYLAAGHVEVGSSELWDPDWRENYRRYLAEVTGS